MEDEYLNTGQAVLCMYLDDYVPFTNGGGTEILMSSEEIMAELSDMVDIDLETIAITMLARGYKAKFRNGAGWSMQAK